MPHNFQLGPQSQGPFQCMWYARCFLTDLELWSATLGGVYKKIRDRGDMIVQYEVVPLALREVV